MHANRNHSFERVPDEDYEDHSLHPLDHSHSVFSYIVNSIFYWWVFKIVKIGTVDSDNIPKLPSYLNTRNSFSKWQNTYKKKLESQKSVSTLSMIYHAEKQQLICILIKSSTGYLLLFLLFFIFKHFLWPIMNKVNSNDIHLGNICIFALILFIIFCGKSILITNSNHQIRNLYARVVSNLYLSIYKKTLSLDLNECDKKQVVSVVGTDVHSIRTALWYILAFGPPIIVTLIFAIIVIYLMVGVSGIFGIIFMIFIGIPCQLFGGYKLSYYGNLSKKSSDKRIQLITELISGIRVLKLCAYEIPLLQRLTEYRKTELSYISKRNFFLSCIILTNFMVPAIMLLITIMVYCFGFGYKVNSNITVFILMLFSLISMGVKGIPIVIGNFASLLVACNRIDTFLQRQSIEIVQSERSKKTDNIIEISNGSFSWQIKTKDEDKQQKIGFSLKNISIKIRRGKLVAIIGSVGSGKTSLIQCILGELRCTQGTIDVNADELVYCSQKPYIRNVSLRDNITLELPFDEIKYKQCIIAACLVHDLQQLNCGDRTIIGDEGVTLSGGQRMRVNFARSLYRKHIESSNKIYLFDDPFSSVDMYVGKHMFVHGIYNYLLDKKQHDVTCLIVINSHLHLLQYFDEIIIMDNGEIKVYCAVNDLFFNSKYENLLQQYQYLLPDIQKLNQIVENEDAKNDNDEKDVELNDFDMIYDTQIDLDVSRELPTWNAFITFIRSSFVEFDYKNYWYGDSDAIRVSEEVKQSKPMLIKLIILFLFSFVALSLGPLCDLWILSWNQNIEQNNAGSTTVFYLSIWFIIVSIIAFGTIYSMRLLGTVSLTASNYIHNKSIYNLLRANTLFFDVTARGDILNRFTTDTRIMDIIFTVHTYQFILFFSSTIGYLFLVVVFIPLSLIPMIIISPGLFIINYQYNITKIPLAISEKNKLSPIITLFVESISNLDSIRAHKLQLYFMEELINRINNWATVWHTSISMTSWLYLYQEILLNFIQLCVIIISVFQMLLNEQTTNNKQFIILSCWYFIAVQQQANYASVLYSEAKESFVSVVRVMEYHNLFENNKQIGKEIIHEAAPINHTYRIKNEKWPNIGNININELRLKYRNKFKIVLDIDQKIHITAGSKIGICGRTGSGKSSILVSIFRLFEPIINDVIIDNKRIHKLGLYDLRSNMSIISQTPVLFNGNLRFNLDPFNKYNDSELWSALKDVELFDLINSRDGKLLCDVNENGSNFSIGEQQLLCFARSICHKSLILFMDEPTSSIDKHSDSLIQKLIRSEKFKNVTVICIAHRLSTIIDYDYILLLENGKIKQYDTPQNLLSDKDGDFAKLLRADRLN